MENILVRFAVVWIVLHVILFFIEWYRYKHSNWSWYGFKRDGMLEITYIVTTIDIFAATIGVIGSIVYFILSPVLN